MENEDFVDGEWYVVEGWNGRTAAHFFQRLVGYSSTAAASCDRVGRPISVLRPSDHVDSEKAHKVNPRRRCEHCWRIEVVKARRG